MNKKTEFIILQHESITPPGSTLAWLNNNHFTYKIIRADSNPTYPILEMHHALIICGGTQNVDQENEFPWLKTEKEFIKSAISKKIKIIGLCLGAQLLAESLGAEVKKASQWEFGWQNIFPNNEELNTIIPKTTKVFQAHGYEFSLPEGALNLAHSYVSKTQAFQTDHILAFQFHPEVDTHWIELCLKEDSESLVNGKIFGEYCQNVHDIRKETKILLEANISWYFKILDVFFKHP